MLSLVSFKGMLINRFSTSRLEIKFLELNLLLEKESKSWRVYLFLVKEFKIGTGNLAKSYVGVLISNKMWQKDGQLSFTGFWTLACP